MSKDKYPVVYTYIKTKDGGRELKASLRSLKNMTNFSGSVYVVGDSEPWFKAIHHITNKRILGKSWLDQVQKLHDVCSDPQVPDSFIVMMDDIYITEPTEVGVYIRGNMDYPSSTPHQRSKKLTAELLRDTYKISPVLDYETHTPMLVEKMKLLLTLNTIIDHKDKNSLQWRSMYGNLWQIPCQVFEDKKTKTKQLKEGNIISTQFFTDELTKMFPESSEYEEV